VELYLNSPDTPPYRGGQLKKAQGQLYLHKNPPCLSYVARELTSVSKPFVEVL